MSSNDINLQILTANELRTGQVVYYTSSGDWSYYISEAQIARDETAADRLISKGEQAEHAQEVVGAYLIVIDDAYDVPVPVRFREKLRVGGPSIHKSFHKPVANMSHS